MQVLVVNNASISSGVSIVQGSTGSQWNDQWLIEPANTTDCTLGVHYGSKNYNHRLATYPDFDYYTHTDKKVYESTNFVSQCLAASGYNYYRPGTYSTDWWYVDKRNHVQNQYYDFNGLTDNWTVTQNWYEPDCFRNFWINTKNKQSCTVSYLDLITSSNQELLNQGIFCFKGDVIMVKELTGNSYKTRLTLYTTEKSFNNIDNQPVLKDVNIKTHHSSSSIANNTLKGAIQSYGFSDLTKVKLEIIHFIYYYN